MHTTGKMHKSGWNLLLTIAIAGGAVASQAACANARLVDFPGECNRDGDCGRGWLCVVGACTKECSDSRECPVPEYRCAQGYCTAESAGECDEDADCLPGGDACAAGECLCNVGSVCDGGRECSATGCGCPMGQRDCGGQCMTATCCDFSDCGGGEVCSGGACECAPTLKRCGDSCIAATSCCLDSDCPTTGETCTAGTCS